MHDDLESQLLAELAHVTAIPFEQFVERALYDPDHGFYAVHGRAGGRRGDFVTSAEIGPLFGAVIADWLDSVWRAEGEPRAFRVTEVGAGVGTLFRAINRAMPACLGALTYTLVERSASMRAAHESLPTGAWHSTGSLPSQQQHVVLANELLDNMAFGIAERVANGWARVDVVHNQGELALKPGNPDPALDHLDGLVAEAPLGCRVPLATQAAAWVNDARALADRVLVFDYGATTAELAARGQSGWLRTYAGHQRGSDPLAHVGRCDITYDVASDQLAPAIRQSTQADWLKQHGLAARVEAARQTWNERAHIGDLQAVVARSAIGEAEALTDPSGLGAFLVLEWQR